MTRRPVLQVEPPDGRAAAVALVLHGGRAAGTGPVRRNQLAVLRMQPFRAGLRRAGRGSGLAVAGLRYAARGWNGATQSPVPDVRWALDQLADRFPDAPVALVGHSMGGRAAMYAAAHPGVRAVVGLAPWLERDDRVDPLTGRHLLVVHGDSDRITSPRRSAEFVQDAASVAASSGYISLRGEGHAMLRRARLWHELATGWVLATMADVPPVHTVGTEAATLLQRVLAGEATLVA
jgi:pimeloyl-ACP methyl ester carboxylesterase